MTERHNYDDITDDDEAFDAIIHDMASECGISDAEMEEGLIAAAQAWERSQSWWRRLWRWIGDYRWLVIGVAISAVAGWLDPRR